LLVIKVRFLLSKNIPQQFYIREEGAPPQPVRCPSCGELIHPPEFYVRKGNASRPFTGGAKGCTISGPDDNILTCKYSKSTTIPSHYA
jgi:hypothetical protein